MSPQDKQHLRFIYNRMVEIYGENPNVDYMLKFNSIIGENPTIIPKSDISNKEISHWSELTGVKYKRVLEATKRLDPIKATSSLHIHEEIYDVNGLTVQSLSAISDAPNSPDYQPTLSVKTIGDKDLGICVEKGCCKGATKDYNGHKHFVCDSCYDHLNNEFDEDYK